LTCKYKDRNFDREEDQGGEEEEEEEKG